MQTEILRWANHKLAYPRITDFITPSRPYGDNVALQRAIANTEPFTWSGGSFTLHAWFVRITANSAVAYQYDGHKYITDVITLEHGAKRTLYLCAIDNDRPATLDSLYVERTMLMFDPEPQVYFCHNELRNMFEGAALRLWELKDYGPAWQPRICAWGKDQAECLSLIRQHRIDNNMDLYA